VRTSAQPLRCGVFVEAAVRNGSQDSASADGINTASPRVTMGATETTMARSGSKLDSPRATSGPHGEWRNSPADTVRPAEPGIVHARNKCLSPVLSGARSVSEMKTGRLVRDFISVND
jgi:hypothetical protein